MPPKSLKASSVFCRVRPFAKHGGHAETDEANAKTLEQWDDKTVTIATEYMFSKSSALYSFPKQVLGPESSQSDVFDTLMPEFLSAFIDGQGGAHRNVMFLAYGQTGTGKTHTMFGTDASLKSTDEPDGWGLFPRVANEVFQRTSGKKFVLQGSAVEFYACFGTDLLAAGAPIMIDAETHMPRGCIQQELKSMDDVLAFINAARSNRKARSTTMNIAEDGHEGSSRSHAALILYLLQVCEDGTCVRTSFSLLDLAGAERPSKTGGKRVSGFEAFMEVAAGKEVSVGTQGTLINFELSQIRDAIVAASNAHAKGLTFSSLKCLATCAVTFISGAFTGASMLGMVVCLSPSGANGWETWFSLEYGKDMAQLKTPLKKEMREEAGKKLQKLEKQVQEALETLKKTPTSGSPAAKYFPGRLGAVMHLAQHALDLAGLLGEGNVVSKAEAALKEARGMDTSKFADGNLPR